METICGLFHKAGNRLIEKIHRRHNKPEYHDDADFYDYEADTFMSREVSSDDFTDEERERLEWLMRAITNPVALTVFAFNHDLAHDRVAMKAFHTRAKELGLFPAGKQECAGGNGFKRNDVVAYIRNDEVMMGSFESMFTTNAPGNPAYVNIQLPIFVEEEPLHIIPANDVFHTLEEAEAELLRRQTT